MDNIQGHDFLSLIRECLSEASDPTKCSRLADRINEKHIEILKQFEASMPTFHQNTPDMTINLRLGETVRISNMKFKVVESRMLDNISGAKLPTLKKVG